MLLEELCFGETLEDQQFYKDCLGADGKLNQFTMLSGAWLWAKSVAAEMGPQYSQAVTHCIALSSTDAVNVDAHFWQGVYDEVVGPLQKVLETFQAAC